MGLRPARPRDRKALRRLLLPAFAAAGLVGPAAAEPLDWRYCLSTVRAQHRAYMTLPFPTDQALQTLEDGFGAALSAAGIQFDSVQCPRGDARAIAAMRKYALRFNRQSGNTVVTVDWRP